MYSKFNGKQVSFPQAKATAQNAEERGIDRLLAVMTCLRTPEHGCPWDLQQNLNSLIPYTIEEAYEVAAAIVDGDKGDIQGELGDLLFQVIFYAQLTDESGWYHFDDVAEFAAEKLMRRHPHVFGEIPKQSVDEIKGQWEAIKKQERAKKNSNNTVFSDIPSNLPSMLRAFKIQKRCASVGFDWDNPEPVMSKVIEEVEEVREVLHERKRAETQDRLEEEIGDLLFAVVNLSRHAKVNPESALQKANQKFMNRFQYVEQAVKRENGDISDYSLEMLESFWQEAKTELKKHDKDC